MNWAVTHSRLQGRIDIPASKSHTIRALLIATLANGESRIKKPLLTGDGNSALIAAKAFGASVVHDDDTIIVNGNGKNVQMASSVFMGNSGTGTNLFTSAAALGSTPICFDGDSSLRTRPMGSLLNALKTLGAEVVCHVAEGKPPYTICGPILGGSVVLDGDNSQYLSSILLTAPLLDGITDIQLKSLSERPYVEMTLWWLNKMNIAYEADFEKLHFRVFGGQCYTPLNETIAGDFSSATFSAVGAALTGGTVHIHNIDFSDPQGDKEIFSVLEQQGISVERNSHGAVVHGGQILGGDIDLNSMPDALPALAVLATQGKTPTRICNVAQARIKETDRIAVMCTELTKMGAQVEELSDGLIVYPSKLTGAPVCGHDDHRVVMALTLAGMVASGTTIVETAEAAAVTYADFQRDFSALGADIRSI